MVERSLRIASIVLSVVVALGFVMFAIDELEDASNRQRGELAGFEQADPSPADERTREQRHGAARELVDDANDILLKPFAGIVTSGSRWAQRAVPTLLGLLVYGFALAFLARYMKGRG